MKTAKIKLYFQTAIRSPTKMLLAWSGLIVLMAMAIFVWPKTNLDLSLEAMVMTNDPDTRFDAMAKDTFGDDGLIVVAVANEGDKGVFTIPTLEKIARISHSVKLIEGVREVYSLADIDDIRGQAGSLVTSDLMTEVPKTQEDLERVERDAFANPTYPRIIVSDDKKVAAINIELARTHQGPEDRDGIVAAVSELVERENETGPEQWYVAGLPVSSRGAAAYLTNDIVGLAGAAVVVMLLGLLIIFRNAQSIAFVCMVCVAGVLTTFGLMTLLGVEISMPLSLMAVFIMVWGLEYSIYLAYAFITQVQEEKEKGRTIRDPRQLLSDAVSDVRVPVILSATVTVVAFLSLTASSVPDLSTMGLFLAIGAATLGFGTLTIVPAIIALWPIEVPPAAEHNRVTSRIVSAMRESAVKRPWLHLAAMVALAVWAAIGWSNMSTDSDVLSWFQKDSKVRIDEEFVRARMSGATFLHAVVVGREAGAFKEPENLRALDEIRAYAETLPHVTRALTHADHVKLINQALHDGDPSFFLIPETKEAVEQSLLLHREPDDFRRTIDRDYRKANVMLRMDDASSSSMGHVEARLEEFIGNKLPDFEANVVGTNLLVHRALDQVTTSMIWRLGIACLVIGLIMSLVFRSIKLGALALFPIAMPVVLTYAWLAWNHRPLDLPTAVIGAIALGIAVNHTVHFLQTWSYFLKHKDIDSAEAVRLTMVKIGRPMVLSSLVVALGFGVMVFSRYDALVWAGAMVCVAAVSTLICDLLFTLAIARLTTIQIKMPKGKEYEAIANRMNPTQVKATRPSFADYSPDEISRMMTYDFFALAGKKVIRQGGGIGTRRLLYEMDLKPGMKLLELGSGQGDSAFYLARRYGVEVVGVDVAEYVVNRANQRAKEEGLADKCSFYVCAGETVPFADQTFDAVLAEAVVMYADARACFAECLRLLKPGGIAGIHDWSWTRRPPPKLEHLANARGCGDNLEDCKFYSERGWGELLDLVGFDIEFTQEFPFTLFSVRQMLDDEGYIGLGKMFGRVLRRWCTIKKMMAIMGWLSAYEEWFGYFLIVARKPQEKRMFEGIDVSLVRHYLHRQIKKGDIASDAV